MAEKKSTSRSRKGKKGGKKAATTKVGKYVREEMHHKRSGKHKIKSRKQAIAIGLSKARKKGIKVPKKKKSK